MERCRPTLLVFMLATSALLASCKNRNTTTCVKSSEKRSLSCATFVKTESHSVTFIVSDSYGTWNITVPLDGCFPTNIKRFELLFVQVTKISNGTNGLFNFTTKVGDCVAYCIQKRRFSSEVNELYIKANDKVACKGTYSRPRYVQYNISGKTYCQDTLKPTRPPSDKATCASSSSATPPPSSGSFVAPEKATLKKLPTPVVVFMVVEAVELVATCVLGVVVVVVVIRRLRGNGALTPATTTVRRVNMDVDQVIYISQNSLYEPFCGNTAAAQQDAQE